jgi:PAS domain S-box-containing protein
MFRSLAEHSQDFIGVCDLEFRPIYVNEAGLRMIGLDSLDEAHGVKVQDFFFPEDRRYLREEFVPKVAREGRAATEVAGGMEGAERRLKA